MVSAGDDLEEPKKVKIHASDGSLSIEVEYLKEDRTRHWVRFLFKRQGVSKKMTTILFYAGATPLLHFCIFCSVLFF